MQSSFAIVIPAFNAEDTIARAIASAFSQTRPPDEIVICNDGSTDRTSEIVASYGNRVKVVNQENCGVSVATNAAVRATECEFVVKLDADDEWLPSRLAEMVRLLEDDPNLDIITTDAWRMQNGIRLGRYYATRSFPDPEAQHYEILRRNFVYASAAIRRDRLLQIGGFDETRAHQGEYDAWIRLILTGSRAGLVPAPLAIYHQRPGSLSTRMREVNLSVIHLLTEVAEGFPLTPSQQAALNDQLEERTTREAVFQAAAAVDQGLPEARRLCWVTARASRLRHRHRALLFAAAVSPRMARWIRKEFPDRRYYAISSHSRHS